jgi:hypothetical protein
VSVYTTFAVPVSSALIVIWACCAVSLAIDATQRTAIRAAIAEPEQIRLRHRLTR